MSPSASMQHNDRIVLLLDRLGYAQDEAFLLSPDSLALSQVSHAVETAFATMGVIGVLCPGSSLGSGRPRSVPVVYVVSVASRAEADARHRAIWSQSIAPFVLIAAPDFVQIRNGFDPRAQGPEVSWEAFADGVPDAFVSLTASNVRSAASWQGFGVDERIGKAIEALSRDIRNAYPMLREQADTINSAIGRFLYLYMLVDRRILDQAWIDGLRLPDGRPACPHIQLDEGWGQGQTRPTHWPADEIWFLFEAIDAVLNGSIFPLQIAQQRLLDDCALHLIRRALRADTVGDGQQQYAFIDVDYANIRTETISSIYECFFELENDGGKAEKGAYYTPPFLVDYIIDEMDAIEPLTTASRVVDPACGSGAFLVGAFRRIVERERRQGREPDPCRLREILETTIMGIEIKPQAANVARFSLYLTMLDYIPGMTLASVREALHGARLFPDLRDRLVTSDTFRPLPKAMRGGATHVLGNPPWTKIAGDATHALAYRTRLLASVKEGEVPFMAKDGPLAEAFFWRAVRDVGQPHGQIAFVMPTKSFIAPQARCFPHAMAARVTIKGITNLAHFREHLFTNARAAATVIFASSAPTPHLNRPWRYSPKPTSQPVGKDGTPWAIVVDRGQVEHFVQSDLMAREHKWFRDLMLQPLDRMIASMLEQRPEPKAVNAPQSQSKSRSRQRVAVLSADAPGAAPPPEVRPLMTLGGFLDRHGMAVLVGDSSVRIGLPDRLVLNTKSNDFRRRLGLIDGLASDYELSQDQFGRLSERYKTLFRGPMILMTRNQSDHYVVDRPVAFSSSIQSVHFAQDRVQTDLRLAVLREIARYLKTSVGRYLLALFGRLWVFDQRRIETPDLKALPFPFESIDDLLVSGPCGMDDHAFTQFCRTAFALNDDLFELAVTEHHDLREGYQDGRRPEAAFAKPLKSARGHYRRVLGDQLAEFLPGSDIDVVMDDSAESFSNLIRIVISLDRSKPLSPLPYQIRRDLSPEAGICLQQADRAVVADVIKPDLRSAFTVERAYADALSVAQTVMMA